jgi:hypothetical protein
MAGVAKRTIVFYRKRRDTGKLMLHHKKILL